MTEIIKMDESTYRIEDGFVRFFLLIGTEAAALIDSGADTPDARQIAESLTELPIILINTHGDGDHTSGTAAFDEIFIAGEDYANCSMQEKYPDTDLKELQDEEVISLGDRTLKIIKIPGHTLGSVAILDVEKRQLIAGDSVQNGTIFMFGKHRAPELYEAALNRLIDLQEEYDTVLASHADAVLDKDSVKKVLEGWKQVQEGKVEYTMADVHGNPVREYQTEFCGFYTE